MKRYATLLYRMGASLKHLEALCHFDANKPLGDDIKPVIREHFGIIRQYCDDLYLTLSSKSAARAAVLDDDQYTRSNLYNVVRELQGRLEDELGAVKFKSLTQKQAEYYETVALFGDQVAANFSDASYDIEEAGKCLALERYTGCVMHLMRSLEVAINAVGLGIGLPTALMEAQTSWENLLKQMKIKIDTHKTAKIPAWMAQQAFYENAYSYLHAIMIAWRNPTMHLDRKYTEPEAFRIYVAVKNLMEHLAEHLDQKGNFTA